MYLLYLDDAGSPGNAAEEYFVLGGVCVFEAQVEWFSREIDKLASPYNAAAPEDIEFQRLRGVFKTGRALESSDWRRGTGHTEVRPECCRQQLQHDAPVRLRDP